MDLQMVSPNPRLLHELLKLSNLPRPLKVLGKD